jgi:hypothetical protein
MQDNTPADVRLLASLPPSTVAEAITLLTCTWEVLGSNLDRDTDYPYLGFSFDVEENAGMIP